jgi:general secretion pathway protein G
MTTAPRRAAERGFTFIELVITLALVGMVSMLALPLYEMNATRLKEAELRLALRTIRTGLDTYKAASDAGSLPRESGESGYPASLEKLIEPQDLLGKRDLTDTIATRRLVILRNLPRDPFSGDPTLTAAQTWNTRAYASRSDDPQPGPDVYDVTSKSTRHALDGTLYADW